MNRRGNHTGEPQRGSTLIELMITVVVLTILMGSVVYLLSQSQQRYANTASVQDATAGARDGLDQIVRELRLAGYPPLNTYAAGVITTSNLNLVASAGGASATATNGGFLTTSAYEVAFEAAYKVNLTFADSSTVSNPQVYVIDYRLEVPTGGATGGCAGLTVNSALSTPTLMRSAVAKNANGSAVTPSFEPFIDNVQNCKNSKILFNYCKATGLANSSPCPDLENLTASSYAKVVLIDLQVQSLSKDVQTGQYRNAEFFATAERINPDQ